MAKHKCTDCDGKGYKLIPETIVIIDNVEAQGIQELKSSKVADQALAADSFFSFLKSNTTGTYFQRLMDHFVEYNGNVKG